MRRKVKKIANVLAMTMLVQVLQPVPLLYASSSVNREVSQGTKGSLSTHIMFDYPISYEKVKSQEMTISLMKGKDVLLEVDLGKNNEIVRNRNGYSVQIKAQNQHGVELTTEKVIASYLIDIQGVEQGDYILKYEAPGYTTYETKKITIGDYSKHVVVNTGKKTFSYGDLDHDGQVTEEDLQILEEDIKQGKHENDLDGDGVVDIVELTYIKHQIASEGGEMQQDTSAIIPVEIMESVEKGIVEAGLEITDGKLEDLFSSGSGQSVTITKQANSQTETLSIPIDLGDEGLETQVIEIVAPQGKGGPEAGNVEVEYMIDGETFKDTIKFGETQGAYRGVHFITRNEDKNTIVIDLGKKVAVKKVTIQVDKVVNETGEVDYVILEEVKFIKDILPEGPQVDQSIVTDIQATAGDKEVSLEWKPVSNVQGYRVFYGEKGKNLTNELNVNEPSAKVEGLENLKTYEFKVRATSDDWMGGESQTVSATPQPSKAPGSPDFLKVEPMDAALKFSWGKTEDATYYKVFYKHVSDSDYTQFIPQGSTDGRIQSNSIAIGGLTNGQEYSLYVTAGNMIGESKPSLKVTGIPESIQLEGPNLPTKNKLDMSRITNIRMADTGNIDMNAYPNGFEVTYNPNSTKDGIKNIVDSNYATHWTAQAGQYHRSEEMIYTFDTPIEMDYMIYVDRLDRNYSKLAAHIKVWEEGDDLSGAGKVIVQGGSGKRLVDEEGREYYILEFPKHTVKQIGVQVEQASYSSISEVVFYEYDSLDSEIKALFANDSFTELAPGVTQEKIDRLRSGLNSEDTYYVSYKVFADELDLAESLLKGETDKLGVVKDEFVSIDVTNDPKRINDWSPLGIVAGPSTEFTIYADIPKGETVQIIPTQYFAEAGRFTGEAITLNPGRNVIRLPQIHNLSGTKGGALYYRYSGNNQAQIKLQIRDITANANNRMKAIPTLELYEWYNLKEEERKEKIGHYIDELTQYVTSSMKGQTENPFNSTEISMRNMLLSLPADQILAGVESSASSRENQIETLYNNVLAWEELIEIVHTTYGWDDPSNVVRSRQNIRYMRMFGGAFMYAAGSHIGIGYGSASALAQGQPTEISHAKGETTPNHLFGWGIAHEIGHNMDRLGKAEVTNNIYSLMGQTYDGNDNTLPSRLETSDKYEEIYKKVSVGDKGLANNVFVQLGMYWQLHLAYDEGKDDKDNGPLSFYNKLFKVYDSGNLDGFSGDDAFAVAASEVAQKNLTEFFTKWGMDLSEAAIKRMEKHSLEERKIQYITDETRRQRLAGNPGLESLVFSANAEVVDDSDEVNNKTVRITINQPSDISKTDLLGYEIFRDGKQIAFITGTTYEDYIGSANNMVFNYEVRAVDILGNVVSEKINAGSIRIEHDNVIDPQYYKVRFETTTGSAITTAPSIIIEFNKTMPTTGIKVTSSSKEMLSGNFQVEVGTKETNGSYTYRVAKEGNFNVNEVLGEDKFINYFNKPGAPSSDTRIWTYDADVMRITGEDITEEFLQKYNVMPLSYPGDNVAFEDYKIALMGHDYEIDEEEVIEEGTLVVVGNYRGDPLYNTIHIKGKFVEAISEDNMSYVERAMNGALYMFAEVPEDGETSDISDGFFIFVPDIQKEAELQGHTDCSAVSVLPVEIMAEMYRYDSTTNQGTRRKTSETLWYTTPSYDSMPKIILQNTQEFLRQEGRNAN